MCYIWQNPTLPESEVSLETLDKLPRGFDYLNLTGGEPTLRRDLHEVVDLLYARARKLEISSNGLYSERLEPIIRKYPNVKIRFSLEGNASTNQRIRGEKNGYETKVPGLLRLKELGGTDLGFAVTIQDDNVDDVIDLFRLAQRHGFELATATLHNGFQFHKTDNVPYNRRRVAKHIEGLIVEQLRTNNVKNWFRAYLNMGLIAKVLGHERLLPCTAGSDFAFVDPFSDVYACNVRPDLKLGNLQEQSWEEIYNSSRANAIRGEVYGCKQNCWMVASAKTAMRHPRFSRIPKGGPLLWVVLNKTRVTRGAPIPFDRYINYDRVHEDPVKPERISFFRRAGPKQVHTELADHYGRFGQFFNR